MNSLSKIGLGTVQWGTDYGIANRTGKPPQLEVESQLELAKKHGISLLDTAYAYGTAEQTIGDLFFTAESFRIVTKTKPLRTAAVTANIVADVSSAFQESLVRLKRKNVYGLLIHHASSLLDKEGVRLWSLLQESKSRGHVEKIGVSVYYPDELKAVLDKYQIDIVQLPFNLYDQRFSSSGLLLQLHESGVEVHVRSVFLQGLLLFSPDELPTHFHTIKKHHERLHRQIKEIGIRPVDACLQFCAAHPAIDNIILGCETSRQLYEIIEAAKKDITSLAWAESFAIDDASIVSPVHWPAKEQLRQ